MVYRSKEDIITGLIYFLEKYLARALFRVLTRCDVNGKRNVPMKGPLLVVANHLSVADPVAIGVFLGRKAIFVAKEELFKNKITGFFVRSFGAFPVYRERPGRQVIRQANEVLRKGSALVIFPEGKRSRSGSLQEGMPGSALIAYHNRVPILPIGIMGTEVIRGTGWIFRRPSIRLNIGEPFLLPEAGSSLTREKLKEYTDLIMLKIAILLEEPYRGFYREKKNEIRD